MAMKTQFEIACSEILKKDLEKIKLKKFLKHHALKTRIKKLPSTKLERKAIRQSLERLGINTPMQKCNVYIISKRFRILDEGNLYTKPHIDFLTEIGLIQDDSKKYINSIKTTQEKVGSKKEESLIIELEEIE